MNSEIKGRLPSRRLMGLGVLTAALLWWAGGVQAQSAAVADSPAQRERLAPGLPAIGTALRLPELTLLDGRRWTPGAGQITVLYWWASTCPFCAQQSPEMHKLWQAHQSRGLQMLALSVDKKPQDALAYLQAKGYSFPAVWVSPEVHQALPKPRGLPITVVLGRDGRVLQAEKGQMFAEDVAQLTQWLK